jgi:hypothetical protein
MYSEVEASLKMEIGVNKDGVASVTSRAWEIVMSRVCS